MGEKWDLRPPLASSAPRRIKWCFQNLENPKIFIPRAVSCGKVGAGIIFWKDFPSQALGSSDPALLHSHHCILCSQTFPFGEPGKQLRAQNSHQNLQGSLAIPRISDFSGRKWGQIHKKTGLGFTIPDKIHKKWFWGFFILGNIHKKINLGSTAPGKIHGKISGLHHSRQNP